MSFNLALRPALQFIDNFNRRGGFKNVGMQTTKIYEDLLCLSRRITRVVVPKLLQAIYPDNLKILFASVIVSSSVSSIIQSMLSFKWKVNLSFCNGVLDKKSDLQHCFYSSASGLVKSVLIAAAFFSWTGTTFLGNTFALARRQKFPEAESIG